MHRISTSNTEPKIVARYSDRKSSGLDQNQPTREREIVNAVGTNVTENTDGPILDPVDVVNILIRFCRGFRCTSGEAYALVLGIIGDPNVGKVSLHSSVINAA